MENKSCGCDCWKKCSDRDATDRPAGNELNEKLIDKQAGQGQVQQDNEHWWDKCASFCAANNDANSQSSNWMKCPPNRSTWPFWPPLAFGLLLFQVSHSFMLAALDQAFARHPCKVPQFAKQLSCFKLDSPLVNSVSVIKLSYFFLFPIVFFFIFAGEEKTVSHVDKNLVLPALLVVGSLIIDGFMTKFSNDTFLFGFVRIASHAFGTPILFSIPHVLAAARSTYKRGSNVFSTLCLCLTFVLTIVSSIQHLIFLFHSDLHIEEFVHVTSVRAAAYVQIQLMVILQMAFIKEFLSKMGVSRCIEARNVKDKRFELNVMCHWVAAGLFVMLIGMWAVVFKYGGGNNSSIPNSCPTFEMHVGCDRFVAWAIQGVGYSVTVVVMFCLYWSKRVDLFMHPWELLKDESWFWLVIFLVMVFAQIVITLVYNRGYGIVWFVDFTGYPFYLIFAIMIRKSWSSLLGLVETKRESDDVIHENEESRIGIVMTTDLHIDSQREERDEEKDQHEDEDRTENEDGTDDEEHKGGEIEALRCKVACWKVGVSLFILLFYVDLLGTLVHTLYTVTKIDHLSGRNISTAPAFLQVSMEIALIIETLLISAGF